MISQEWLRCIRLHIQHIETQVGALKESINALERQQSISSGPTGMQPEPTRRSEGAA